MELAAGTEGGQESVGNIPPGYGARTSKSRLRHSAPSLISVVLHRETEQSRYWVASPSSGIVSV